MTDTMNDMSLTVSRTIKAPVEKVFDAWLDPKMLARFMTPGEGMSVPSAKTDPVEGGRFEIIMKAGDDEMPHAGTYKTIKRNSQLVFSWESPYSTDGSIVTLDFAPVAGGTEVTLTHVKFVSEESRDNHKAGWAAILAVLGSELEAA
ncbi:SRPBCC domain-containing protein [Pelagibacterium halotolerans]|uniref:SRPBCC family protein n=1 Tax=Pelagibacterium halotolerans TaxID=531813 RepID=UPI00384F09AC